MLPNDSVGTKESTRGSVCDPVTSERSVVQTLRGSFSAVSKPIFAIKYSVEWKALDAIYQVDSPLHRYTRKISVHFRQTFCKFCKVFPKQFANVCIKNIAMFVDFHIIYLIFHRYLLLENANYTVIDLFPEICRLLNFGKKNCIFLVRKCRRTKNSVITYRTSCISAKALLRERTGCPSQNPFHAWP
jgi:hypothetical protein